MRYCLAVVFWSLAGMLFAQDWEDQRIFGNGSLPLTVLSSTDTVFFVPLIEAFLKASPDIAIDYRVTSTAQLDKIFRADPARYDVVVSSAMDLQLKLANDGFASTLDGLEHPDWAQWRHSVFGFTSEPAAIVVNNAVFEPFGVPKTRQDLIAALRDRPDVFAGKLGTYDVRSSGLGYLFATQDARASETFWRLTEVMGGLGTRLYCCSGDMIDDILSGDLLVAYNVLGSYAATRLKDNPHYSVVLPSDFPTTMMRTALVSQHSDQQDAAGAFLRHMVQFQTGSNLQERPLPPLNVQQDRSEFVAIPLEPGLLTYLDRLKRRTFLQEWQNAIVQTR